MFLGATFRVLTAVLLSIVLTTSFCHYTGRAHYDHYIPLTLDTSSARLNPVSTVSSRSSLQSPLSSSVIDQNCALILQRQYTSALPTSSYPSFFQNPSTEIFDDELGPAYDISIGNSDYLYPERSLYDDYNYVLDPRVYGHAASRYKRSPTNSGQRRRRKRKVGGGQLYDVCITYSDIDQAFQLASTRTTCKTSRMAPGSESTVQDITTSADCIMEISRILAERFDMSVDEITNALPLIDTTKTRIFDVCTGNLKPKPCTAEKFSEISGTCNNLKHPTWGANRTPFIRLLPPVYNDGFDQLRKSVVNNEELPLPRKLSSVLHNDVEHTVPHLTQMFMEFGQVFAHDTTFAAPTLVNQLDFKCCGVDPSEQNKNCHTITIPTDDPFHGPAGRTCMEFKRTFSGQRENCGLGPREQINELTHMIDMNFVYGSTTKKNTLLRSFKDGQMATALPEALKRNKLKPLLPPRTKLPDKGCIGRNRTNGLFCFEAGDGRVNENIFMVALQTVFLREHNRIALELKKLNPHWDEERLYQEARRINIGMYQHIVYNEYVPVIIGLNQVHKWNLTLSSSFWTGYDNTVNMGVANSFMSASFRFSHSNVDNKVNRYNKQHQLIASHDLREFFRRPFDFYEAGIADEFILGMVDQPIQDTDTFMSSEVTNHLFQEVKKSFGIDLASTNIKRGRDHGVPSYTAFRDLCGLSSVRNFQDLGAIFQNNTAVKFAQIYKHVDDIDLWSGGIAEIHLPNAVVGPTFACLIGIQFRDLRRGDRFWYENPGWPSSFTTDQLSELKKITMAKIVCDNSDDIETIQLFTMELAHPRRNPRFNCNDIPGVNLSLWRERSAQFPFAYYDFKK